MRKFINIFILLLSATAVLSCSVKDMLPDMSDGKMELSITVTGAVSDKDSNKPIEEIKITLNALEHNDNGEILSSKSAYTDNNGKFAIIMSGFRNPISFKITAEDPNGTYETGTHEIPLVSWDKNYNTQNGTFFVNGCDFYLKKVK